MLRFKRLCANFCPPKIQAQKCVTNFESVWTFCCRLTGEQLQEDDRLRQEVIASIYFPWKYFFRNLRKCFLPKYSNGLLLQNQVDRLAQDFSLASKEESLDAIDIGERMLELMDRWGFILLMMTRILYNDRNFDLMRMMIFTITSTWQSMSKQWWLFGRLGFSPSVTWPGYLRLTELLLKVKKTRFLWLPWTSSQAGQVSKAQKFAEVSYHLVCLAKGKNSLDAQKVASLRWESLP